MNIKSIQESLDRIDATVPTINVLADGATEMMTAISERLKGVGLPGYARQFNCGQEVYWLSYERHRSELCFCVQQLLEEKQDGEHELGELVNWFEASRQVKVASMTALPRLLEEMAKAAETAAVDSQEAVKSIGKLS